MIHLGQASIDDLLEGFVAFRRLCPIDARLHAALPRQSPPAKDVDLAIPRKGSAAHAGAVAGMLRAARDIDREEASRSLSHFLYIGDSAGTDGRAFASLCRVTGWSGRALIIDEDTQPPASRCEAVGDGMIVHANRWAAIAAWVAEARSEGFGVDGRTVAIVDIDKTLIGARGRNSAAIDAARLRAALDVTESVAGHCIDVDRFEATLRTLDQPAWHSLTADNQDAVVYVALIASLGVLTLEELASCPKISAHGFAPYLAEVGKRQHLLPPGVRCLHHEVWKQVERGNPTPFVAFRRREYKATREALACASSVDTPKDMLETGIVMTGEVWQAVREWKDRDVLVFGLSDKPDEACFPPPESFGEEDVPIHRIPMPIVGGSQ